MTFQTEKALFMANEHFGIHGPMRFMTSHATLQAHGRMFKGKRTSFVGMALDAGGFVTERHFRLVRLEASMLFVAIHTVDGSFL